MIVGGMWCSWCVRLERFLEEHGEIMAQLQRRFIVVRVHYSSENENEEFLASYPPIPGCPHFFILASNGVLLHSQDTAELETSHSYSVEAFDRFLLHWTASQGAERD